MALCNFYNFVHNDKREDMQPSHKTRNYLKPIEEKGGMVVFFCIHEYLAKYQRCTQ